MSTASATSSTTTCPTNPKATSTASAAPRAPAREGIAISFCDGEERSFLRDIERLIRLTIPASGEVQADTGPAPRGGRNQRHGGPRPHRGGGEGRPQRHGGGAHRGGEGRPQRDGESRPHRGRDGDSRPQPNGEGRPHRSHEGRPQRADGPPRGERRNDNGNRPAQPHHRGEGHRSEGQRHEGGRKSGRGAPQGKVAYDGEIGSVAFLKREERTSRKDGVQPVSA